MLPLREALQALPRNTRILACVISADAVPISSAVPSSSRRISDWSSGRKAGSTSLTCVRSHECGATTVHLGSRTFPSRLAGAIATSLLLAAAGDLDAAAAPPPS